MCVCMCACVCVCICLHLYMKCVYVAIQLHRRIVRVCKLLLRGLEVTQSLCVGRGLEVTQSLCVGRGPRSLGETTSTTTYSTLRTTKPFTQHNSRQYVKQDAMVDLDYSVSGLQPLAMHLHHACIRVIPESQNGVSGQEEGGQSRSCKVKTCMCLLVISVFRFIDCIYDNCFHEFIMCTIIYYLDY